MGEATGARMKDNTTRQTLTQRNLEQNKIGNEKLLKKTKVYEPSCEKDSLNHSLSLSTNI